MDDIIKQKEKPEKTEMNAEKASREPKIFPSAIKWEAPEYEYIPKSNNWFWSIVIVVIGISFCLYLARQHAFCYFCCGSRLRDYSFWSQKTAENPVFIKRERLADRKTALSPTKISVLSGFIMTRPIRNF